PALATAVDVDLPDVHDRRRSLGFRIRPDELGLAVPRMAVLHLDVAGDRPHRAAARELAAREVLARAEGEHVEPVVTAANRVRLVEVPVDDAVARPDLVRLPVHPGQPRATEDVEGLLRLAVHVRR